MQDEIDAARVVREVARIAFADESKDSGPEVKPADRLRALDMLAKHLNLYEAGEKAKASDTSGVVILPDVLPEDEP
ncbi:MAG TPA: hypothetical protein VN446_06860 [Candidatus Acidoferrum sp.]|nr:hypothetical protein [Candidatus Acidoferrum sp.]